MKKFKQVPKDSFSNFPFPTEKDLVMENAPTLIWLPDSEDENPEYKVVLRHESGKEYHFNTKKTYCYLNEIIPSGKYEWNVWSKDKERGWISFTLSENAVKFIRPTAEQIFNAVKMDVHPRVLFFKEDIPEIVRTHTKELDVLKRNVEKAYRDGIPKPPYEAIINIEGKPSYNSSRKYFGRFRDYADSNLVACCLAYQLLNDKKAGEFAKKFLLCVSDWDLTHEHASAYCPNDEVGISILRTTAIAFDLIYDLLNEDEKDKILKVIKLNTFQAYDNLIKINYEENPGASHPGRTPGYIGTAALMLKGIEADETVLKYLDLVINILGGIFPFYGSTDGGWADGVFYSTSYTKWYLPFMMEVERLTGISYLERPFYQNLSNFFLHFADQDFENHPFGDGYWCLSESEEWPGFFAQDPFRVYAEKFGPSEAVKKQKSLKQPEIYKLHLLDLFLPKPMKPKYHITRPASLAEAFKLTGVLSMRSTFETKGCMAVMSRASRYGSAGHSHADQGSFALFYEGTSLISPSGYFGYSWGTKHHQEWTCQTKAHNTILVNGEGMPNYSRDHTGEIEYCRQNGNVFEALMNLDNSYKTLNSWKRKLTMYADEKTLVVEDTVSADDAVTLDWLLHSLSHPTEEGGIVYVKRNGITLKIEVLEGLKNKVIISDKFDTDLNDDVSPENHAVMPPQYHMKWQTELRKSHCIRVKLTISK